MVSSSGLLPRAVLGLAALLAALAAGCAHEPGQGAVVVDASAARRRTVEREVELATLHYREAALAEKAELLELRRRDLMAMEQSVRKLAEATQESADLAMRLKRVEDELAAARREADEARSNKAPAVDYSNDLAVRRLNPDAREATFREALRTVQALVDSGQVKAMVKGGRVIFVLPRQLDEVDPYGVPPGRRELRSFESGFEQ
jgi:hypothetical protein